MNDSNVQIERPVLRDSNVVRERAVVEKSTVPSSEP